MINKDELLIQYEQWLQHPITKHVKALLEQHRATIITSISNSSVSIDVPDSKVRHLAVQLRTTETIQKIVYDTQTFIAKSSSK